MYSDKTPALPKGLGLEGSIIVGTNPHYKVLGKYLAVSFDSEYLQNQHQRVKEMGEYHSYPDFLPHVSLFKCGADVKIDLDALPKLPAELRLEITSESINEVEE